MQFVNLEEDSDEGGNWFANDAANELSHEKMCYVRNAQHPRTVKLDHTTEEKKYVEHSCFSTMGWSHCTKNMRKTEYARYGAGIVLYFQFLKYICLMLFLFSVLSIPSYIMFSTGRGAEPSASVDS